MKKFLLLFFLLGAIVCSAGNVNLADWSYSDNGKGGSCSFENGTLIIRSARAKWVCRSKKTAKAVAGKAVKLGITLKIVTPQRAMLTVNLYAPQSNEPFHTMKIADTADFVRKYEKIINIPEKVSEFELEFAGSPQCALEISDINAVIVPALETPAVPAKRPPLALAEGRRHSENLDRGVIAFEKNNGTYISWRLLKSDPENITFDVYRDGRKINTRPVADTTDYFDSAAGKTYTVKPANCSAISGSAVRGTIAKDGISYCRIYRLADKKARVDKVGIGDLDGDGVYDYVVRYYPANVDPWYTACVPSEGTCKFEAINGKTGKIMWKKDLGWSIETGIWYSPFVVYDLDGDGKAEVALKTGEGDPRDADGKVTTGREFLTILDGVNGKELCRADWPPRDGFLNLDISYNFYSRNQMAIAYVDGKTPHLIVLRGTYSLMLAEAWKLKDKKLQNVWKYSSAGREKKYQGQGAHSTRCGDVDGDGKDEIVLGNMALDDNGDPLWSNGQRHPDFIYLADLIPQRKGLEVATCREIDGVTGGLTLSCARTGKCIWELKEPVFHVHFGFCGDIDPVHRGVLVGGTDRGAGNKKYPACAWVFTGDGKLLDKGLKCRFFGESPIFVYWDGDLRREYHSTFMRKYNGGEVGGATQGTLIAVADVRGDWREEIITAGEGEIRVYSTDIPAMDRRVCLMQDHFYRMAAATASCGYHYDSQPEILPSSISTDVVLTLKKSNLLQITVTAPMQKKVAGKLELVLPDGITGDFKSSDIQLEEGGIWNKIVNLSGGGVGKKGEIKAHLVLDNGKLLNAMTLAGKQTMPKLDIKLPGYWIDAENFKSQSNGRVAVRVWNGVHRRCITAWLKAGHKVNWELNIGKAGKYKIIFRYATKRTNVYRRLVVNGKDYGDIRFLPTGAPGKSALDWTSYSPDILLELPAGLQKFSLECTSGALSLDAISFVRVQ